MSITYLLTEKGKDTRVKNFEMQCSIYNDTNMNYFAKSSFLVSIYEDDFLDLANFLLG